MHPFIAEDLTILRYRVCLIWEKYINNKIFKNSIADYVNVKVEKKLVFYYKRRLNNNVLGIDIEHVIKAYKHNRPIVELQIKN